MSISYWSSVIKRAHHASVSRRHQAPITYNTSDVRFKCLASWLHYLPDQLAHDAHSTQRVDHHHYVFRGVVVDLYVMHNNPTAVDATEFVKMIDMSVAFLQNVSRRRCDHIQILWVPLDSPKTTRGHCIHDSPCVLGPMQVNSGYTMAPLHGRAPKPSSHTIDDACGQIVVYRKEEACKVCIHEIVHLWGYDNELLDDQAQHDLSMYLSAAFNLKALRVPITPREAVTDVIAIMLYSGRHGDAWYERLLKNRTHVLKQAAKVLQLQQIAHWNMLKHMPSNAVVFSENTHVFSYYVLKAALYYQLETLLKVIHKHSPALTKDYCIVAIMRGTFHRHINKLLTSPLNDESMRMSFPHHS